MNPIFGTPALVVLARFLVTCPFWISGVAKSIHFDLAVSEMARFGLEPAILFNLATIAVQLGGSAMLVSGRFVWCGTATLVLFTSLTIPLVHHFWSIAEEPFRTIAFHTASEHVGLIGGLIAAAALSSPRAGAAPARRKDRAHSSGNDLQERITLDRDVQARDGRKNVPSDGNYFWF
ncbi:DoxX family protein [Ancylobacter sp. G4_0304]|uniref:DoxX family protein n=1 Tax=Ancylobacter sp. G4_0304 TaxID=3114289 RepID=UPI0039C642B6